MTRKHPDSGRLQLQEPHAARKSVQDDVLNRAAKVLEGSVQNDVLKRATEVLRQARAKEAEVEKFAAETRALLERTQAVLQMQPLRKKDQPVQNPSSNYHAKYESALSTSQLTIKANQNVSLVLDRILLRRPSTFANNPMVMWLLANPRFPTAEKSLNDKWARLRSLAYEVAAEKVVGIAETVAAPNDEEKGLVMKKFVGTEKLLEERNALEVTYLESDLEAIYLGSDEHIKKWEIALRDVVSATKAFTVTNISRLTVITTRVWEDREVVAVQLARIDWDLVFTWVSVIRGFDTAPLLVIFLNFVWPEFLAFAGRLFAISTAFAFGLRVIHLFV